MTKKKETVADLRRKIMEIEAQMAHQAHFAIRAIDKAGEPLMGSAVVLRLQALGGREIISPIAIRDGLSKETIECLKKDFKRTYEGCTLFKP